MEDELNANEQLDNSTGVPLEVLKESKRKKKAEWLAPYAFKKGQSGNPTGRKPGKSLKEYAKEMLASMTDEERQEYLQGIDKKTIWEMAENKAAQDTDITSKGEKIVFPILGGITNEVPKDNSGRQDTETKESA